MYQTKHFVTGNFVSHSSFVDDATYSTILDNIVKATCDIFLTRPASADSTSSADVSSSDADVEVLLGERVGLPHADWWIPGGRMMPGETCQTAAKRILHRELGLLLDDPARVRTVGHFTFVWDTRTQEPICNGTCDVSMILRIDLTRGEADGIKQLSKEYKALEWRTISSQLCLPQGTLHPALAQGLVELSAMRQWDQLKQLLKARQGEGAADAPSSEAIVEKLILFCKQRGEL